LAELDSLADFVSFGVAPAFILYTFGLNDLRAFGWIVALLFAIAACLRLARFNVSLEDHEPAGMAEEFLRGHSRARRGAAGAAACQSGSGRAGAPHRLCRHRGCLCALHRLHDGEPYSTYSGKTLGTRVPRERVVPLFGLVVLVVALLATFTFEVLTTSRRSSISRSFPSASRATGRWNWPTRPGRPGWPMTASGTPTAR
jgi:CDP-diacylglycerol--serine O-phosphatidyltransferase